MKIQITRPFRSFEKGHVIDNCEVVQAASFMTSGAAKEVGTPAALTEAQIGQLSMAQMRAIAVGRKIPGCKEMDPKQLAEKLTAVKTVAKKTAKKKTSKKKAKTK